MLPLCLDILRSIPTYIALKEANIRCLRTLYLEKLKMQTTEGEATTSEVQEIPHKESGKPLLLPDKLDVKVQECVKELYGETELVLALL